MSEQAQPTMADLHRQLEDVVLGLQRFFNGGTGDDGDGGGGGGGGGLSTQSNGCSTYSIHCHAAVARL